MNRKLYSYFFLIYIIFFFIKSADLKSESRELSEEYPFLSTKHNYIQYYKKSSLKKFKKAWEKSSEKKFIVLHIGDSHLQNDVFPGRIRNNLQELLGYGGRGMMFPFSAAGTYSNRSYKTEHSGFWEYSKNTQTNPVLPLGVSGMSVRTVDPNSTLVFQFRAPQPEYYKYLKLFMGPEDSAFHAEIHTGESIYYPEKLATTEQFFHTEISSPNEKIILKLTRDDTGVDEFHFYGMSLESINDSGIVWHNAGVDGAGFKSILRSSLFFENASALKPDLVILDLGTNEYAATDKISDSLESEIVSVVQKIKKSCNNPSIIINSTQDMSYKGKNLKSGTKFLKLIKKISRECSTGFYDFYSVAGGKGSMSKWFERGLSNKDLIHLIDNGYILKGDLYTQALINTYDVLQNSKQKSFIIK